MSFFLKKTKNKKGVYLQIYEGFYDPKRGHAAQRSFKSIGYLHDLIDSGIDDPIAHFKSEVDSLNQNAIFEKKLEKQKLISDITPEKYLGYFPFKNINDALGVKNHLSLLQSQYCFDFNVYDVLSSCLYARLINPSSKFKTFYDVIPMFYDKYDYSLNQLYSALNFFGNEYEKIIEIYNLHINKKYGFNQLISYFDCTNFYFEIDKEDELRRKGPSKENRNDPIVGMGLLLDANQIPIGMKIFPGNESEQPIIREVINSLKIRQNITGKTIRVADKGLNSVKNIVDALKEGDGYIFSKSITKLSQTEKTWVLLDQDFKNILNNKGELVYRIKECVDDFPYVISDENGKKRTIYLKEKRVITYNAKLARKKKLEIQRQIEKAKKLYVSQAKRNEYGDSAKYVNFEAVDKDGESNDGKVKVSINQKAIDEALRFAGYNLIVSSETGFSSDYIYETYHNLWRIEESFKIMKSHLDARPVYLQKQESIIGHFLICYLSILLLRILQFKVLDSRYSFEDIIKFTKEFRAIEVSKNQWINITKSTTFIQELASITKLPLTSYYLSKTQIKTVLNNRF